MLTSTTAWQLQHRFELLIAKVRGMYFMKRGLVSSDHAPAIGCFSKSFFDQNSKIIIQKSEIQAPANAPKDFNSEIASLGLLNPIKYQNPPSRSSRFRFCEGSQLIIGEHSKVGPGFYFSIGQNTKVKIGSWSYIGSDMSLYSRFGISVGNRCMISHGLTLMDYDGHPIVTKPSDKDHKCDYEVDYGKSSPINIEDDVWIGANVTILKGVTIGSGSVISSGAVVIKDVPRNCLAGGNPAKVVRENIEWRHF